MCQKRKRDEEGDMKVKKKVRFNLDHSSDDVSFFILIFLLKKFIRKKQNNRKRYIYSDEVIHKH